VPTVTIGASVALIIIGAILKFGVTWHAANIDIQVIGVILMVAGVAGVIFAATLMAMRRRDMQRRTTPAAQVYEERRYTEPPA
jgi:uncharacterized membrane protein YhaH (DUF805 family)